MFLTNRDKNIKKKTLDSFMILLLRLKPNNWECMYGCMRLPLSVLECEYQTTTYSRPSHYLYGDTKVDIMIRWDDAGDTAGEYDVLVDGVSKAEDQRFGNSSSTAADGSNSGGESEGRDGVGGGGVERVGLYVLGEGRAWFDEIYLGPDFTMGEGEWLCYTVDIQRSQA